MPQDWKAIRKGHRLQTSVPGVIMSANANEDAKLKHELEKIRIAERSRLALSEQAKKSFVIQRTMKAQQLYGHGYLKSLQMMPIDILEEYKYTLHAFLDEPLRSLVKNKSEKTESGRSRKHSNRSGNSRVKDEESEEDSEDDYALKLPKIIETNDLEVQVKKQSKGEQDLRLSLPSIRESETIHSPPPRNGFMLPKINGDEEMDVCIPVRQKRLPNALHHKTHGSRVDDTRFTNLLSRLEQKSAWKRKYIAPPKPTSKIVGNSLDELAAAYKSSLR